MCAYGDTKLGDKDVSVAGGHYGGTLEIDGCIYYSPNYVKFHKCDNDFDPISLVSDRSETL